MQRDADGKYRFAEGLINADRCRDALLALKADSHPGLGEAEIAEVLAIYERVFRHRAFTGRSGTMFAYEGLGSIYWHMVAKLLLAVQEVHLQATREDPASDETRQLATAYEDIRNGLGFTKSPETYGAFPSDPYSHTPRHRGAQQPGMTGQVKEEILTRMGELGVHIERGCVRFAPALLQRNEFFSTPHTFGYIDLEGESQTWDLGPDSLAFTVFQVPVCYLIGSHASIRLDRPDGSSTTIEGDLLPEKESSGLFQRNGLIRAIVVTLAKTHL